MTQPLATVRRDMITQNRCKIKNTTDWRPKHWRKPHAETVGLQLYERKTNETRRPSHWLQFTIRSQDSSIIVSLKRTAAKVCGSQVMALCLSVVCARRQQSIREGGSFLGCASLLPDRSRHALARKPTRPSDMAIGERLYPTHPCLLP